MEKHNKKRVVFLCSGGGGNLCFIDDAIKRNWINNAEITHVLTDRECQANRFATSVGINNQCLDFIEKSQNTLISVLQDIGPDLIITTVHKIIQKPVIDLFSEKFINLHYSLLPAFGGLIGSNTVKAALAYGAKFTGVTVHYVNEHVDQGRPITQGIIPVKSHENFKDIMNFVFRCGCLALMTSINSILNHNKEYKLTEIMSFGRKNCIFSEGVNLCSPDLLTEFYWHNLAEKLGTLHEK